MTTNLKPRLQLSLKSMSIPMTTAFPNRLQAAPVVAVTQKMAPIQLIKQMVNNQ